MTATHLRPAEAFFPGHPDKLCDAAADALVQEASRREKRAFAQVEVSLGGTGVLVWGQIACRDAEGIDVPGVVGRVFAGAGNPAVRSELRLGPLGEADARRFSPGQGVATGFAMDLPGASYLPPEHWLAWRLSRALWALRGARPELRLGPAGGVLVVLEDAGDSYRLASVSASLSQAADGPAGELQKAVRRCVQQEVQEGVWRLPGFSPAPPEEVHVRLGGEWGDGQAGRKLLSDGYGPRAPLGGPLSGRDFFQPARAGAVLARRVAKAAVLTGAARQCKAVLAFLPGQEHARLLSLCDETGRALDPGRWAALVDLSLAGCGERYAGAADLVRVAQEGHFSDPQWPWEQVRFDPASG